MTFEEKIQNKINKLNLINILYATVGDDPFWFDDVKDITSPQMLNSLKNCGVVTQTGITKVSFICINDYEDIYKKVTAKQWQFCEAPDKNAGYLSIIATLQDEISFLERCRKDLLQKAQEQQEIIIKAQLKINKLY